MLYIPSLYWLYFTFMDNLDDTIVIRGVTKILVPICMLFAIWAVADFGKTYIKKCDLQNTHDIRVSGKSLQKN